ncbi:hypothetical protein ACHAWC_009795 [Mediolabrus comicus]
MIIAERSAGSSCKANSASLSGNNTPQPAQTQPVPNIVDMVQADTNARDNGTAHITRRSRSRGKKDMRSNERETVEVCGVPLCKDSLILDEPSNAFAWFKERYPGLAAIESNKSALKSKYLEAKSTGTRIEDHKRNIDYHRGMMNKETDPSRVKLNSDAMMNEKKGYKDSLSKLRELKKTIESSQKVIEAGRLQMQSDFDRWHSSCTSEHTSHRGHNIPEPSPEQEDKQIKGDDASQGDDANFEFKLPPGMKLTGNKEADDDKKPIMLPPGIKLTGNKEADDDRQGDDASIEFKLPPGIKLTGNKEADDDIIAFYRAKELLLAKASAGKRI